MKYLFVFMILSINPVCASATMSTIYEVEEEGITKEQVALAERFSFKPDRLINPDAYSFSGACDEYEEHLEKNFRLNGHTVPKDITALARQFPYIQNSYLKFKIDDILFKGIINQDIWMDEDGSIFYEILAEDGTVIRNIPVPKKTDLEQCRVFLLALIEHKPEHGEDDREFGIFGLGFYQPKKLASPEHKLTRTTSLPDLPSSEASI